MILKQKPWWFPAKNMYTTIGYTIWCPKGVTSIPRDVLEHEMVHMKQQKRTGLLKFLFLYLFALPFFYNKWRYKWEYEAYSVGSGLDHEEIVKILSSKEYGYLKHKERYDFIVA